jgi:hypothetical protein
MVMSIEPLGEVQEVFGVAKGETLNGVRLSNTVAEAVEVQPFAPVTVTE